VAFGSVFAAGAWGATELWRWARGDDVLPIRTVAVDGTSSERANEVRAFAGVQYGEPLLSIDTERAAQAVREHPWVREAAVRLVPPDGVAIEVLERRAVATLALPDALYLLDEDGTPFKRARPGDGLDLPVITGVETTADDAALAAQTQLALRALAAHEDAGAPGGAASEAFMETPDRVVLVTADDLRVSLGGEDFRERTERLAHVLQLLRERSEQPSHVRLDDGRRPERVAVRLRAHPEMGEKPGT
jgi:cell division protein FtsQ